LPVTRSTKVPLEEDIPVKPTGKLPPPKPAPQPTTTIIYEDHGDEVPLDETPVVVYPDPVIDQRPMPSSGRDNGAFIPPYSGSGAMEPGHCMVTFYVLASGLMSSLGIFLLL
jgi:hypothetical protein